MGGRARRGMDEWRPSAVTLGAPAYPLAVLFGLNACDELDRTAFSVLLPDIRDHFGLSDAGALGLVSASTVAVVLIGVPLSFYADRSNRLRLARIGAAVWAFLSAATGAAVSVGTLVLARIGAGSGRAVVTPTHASLLSDYYQPAARVKVFSVHAWGNSLGQIVGPLVAGVLALWFGWRTPFVVFAVPTLVIVVLSLRLREPERGVHERRIQGGAASEPPVSGRETMRILHRVRTIRRIWCAIPLLGVLLFGVPNLLSLVYEEVFDLDSAARGAIAAGVEPLQIIGMVLAMPRVSARAVDDPGFLLRFVSIVGVVDGVLLVVLSHAPAVGLAIACHALLAASIGTLTPAFYALMSVVAPPRVRSAAFATMAIFAIPGFALLLPLLGAASDAWGPQTSMLLLVPLAAAAGMVLSSAAPFVREDAVTGDGSTDGEVPAVLEPTPLQP